MELLAPLMFSAPTWLLLTVGFMYALLTLERHRDVSLLAAFALGGFLALDVVGTIVWATYEWFAADTPRGALAGWVTNAFWFVQTLAHAAFMGLAIAAAARGRADARR